MSHDLHLMVEFDFKKEIRRPTNLHENKPKAELVNEEGAMSTYKYNICAMTWGRWLQKQLSDIFGEIFSFPIIFAWSGLINHRQCAKYNLMKDDIPWELINDQQFIPVLDHNKEVKGRWWYTRPSYLLKRHCCHRIFLEGHCHRHCHRQAHKRSQIIYL